ncbi:MAG TPA: hypothetical protein VE734_06385 [Terriglobales bacterium]|nr:hypothetical protein [Terriglobales bacterium]
MSLKGAAARIKFHERLRSPDSPLTRIHIRVAYIFRTVGRSFTVAIWHSRTLEVGMGHDGPSVGLDPEERRMTSEDWIFPVGEGICVDAENGRWSDAALFDDQHIPVDWYPAEPAPHVQDRELWMRWLEFLETSPSAAEILLIVAKSRACAKVRGPRNLLTAS